MLTRSASQSTPVKSKSQSKKKQTHTTPKRNPNLLTTQTPEKQQPTPPLTRRARNRGVALSIKEVRQIASQARSEPRNQTDQIKSARKQILSWPTGEKEAEAEEDARICRKAGNVAQVGPTKLPEKYEMLGEFFDSLDSSIRLLKLKGSMTTFTNVSPKIECLSDRRFTHKHLSQLKFILPEAIEIKKMLVFDERTCCMKPDLHVAVNVDAIECEGKSKTDSKNLYLRKVFRQRLLDFHKAHPQGDEVPEEPLPEPFNCSQKGLHSNISSTAREFSAVETSTEALVNQQLAAASHLPQSFQRRFSQTATNNEADKIDPAPLMVFPKPSGLLCLETNVEPVSDVAPSQAKLSSTPSVSGKWLASCVSSSRLPGRLPATPVKEMGIIKVKDGSPSKVDVIQSTPAKLASTPVRLMTATPVLHPPKRCYMSPDEDSTNTPKKLVTRPPRTRSLKFETPVKNEKFENELNEMEAVSVDDNSDDDNSDILPEYLLQSIREKERKALEERDPAISQAKRRQQMIAFLPKLFNMIHFLFQSLKRSVITKEELMHKIVASHCDIVDRREVEEQLSLLLELAPEWISEKSASSGDLLISVNRTSSAESIRARLAEAK